MDEGEGIEPDYRFTLANERTFLAWIRTSLALLAGGIALRELTRPFAVAGARLTLAAAAIVLSLVLSVMAYLRWVSVQRSMRREADLPPSVAVPLLAAALIGIAVTALALVVW